jgi:hypothetical protein
MATWPITGCQRTHRDLAEVARHAADANRSETECEPHRSRSRTETDALPADVPGQLRTAPRPVAQRATLPMHRDLADANRKPHANAPQRDRLPTCTVLIGQFRQNARAAGRTLHGCLAAKFCPPIRLRAASVHRMADAPPSGRKPLRTTPMAEVGFLANRKRMHGFSGEARAFCGLIGRRAPHPHANAPQRDRLPTCTVLIGQFRQNARAAGRTLHGCLAAKFFPPIRLRAASVHRMADAPPSGRKPLRTTPMAEVGFLANRKRMHGFTAKLGPFAG